MAQISQETFDEVVKENMTDFDMPEDEATLDAIAQFESQGVDLSNIITAVCTTDASGAGAADVTAQSTAPLRSPDELLLRLKALIAALHSLPQSAGNESEIVSSLDELMTMVETVPATKVIAGRNDAMDPLIELLDLDSEDVIVRACVLMASLCTDNSDNQDFVGQQGLQRIAGRLTVTSLTPGAIVALLSLVRAVCVKHESNKAHFAKAHGVDAVCLHLDAAKDDLALSKQLAAVLRVMTTNDDPKATFSQAQDTTKLLVAKELIPYSIETVTRHREHPDLLAAWLMVLKQIAITEENCKKIFDLAGLDLLFEIMIQHERHLTVVKRCITVFRNVAAADDIKEYIITSGGAAQILVVMQTHLGDVSIQQHACATLAAIALRSPANSSQLVDMGVARQIAFAMRTHKTDTALLRQASLAIRNMVARAPELRARILDEDVEELLRDAQQYRGCGDEAYAALRDLGCNIQLSAFGTSTMPKAQFNPVNVESNKLLESVDEAAEAPFAMHA